MRRLLVWSLSSILTLICLGLIALVGALFTSQGLTWVGHVASYLVPNLQVGSISGSILNLHIEDLHYDDESLVIDAQSFGLTWSPLSLTEWRISALTSQDLTIKQRATSSSTESSPLALPTLSITASGVDLKNTQYCDTTQCISLSALQGDVAVALMESKIWVHIPTLSLSRLAINTLNPSEPLETSKSDVENATPETNSEAFTETPLQQLVKELHALRTTGISIKAPVVSEIPLDLALDKLTLDHVLLNDVEQMHDITLSGRFADQCLTLNQLSATTQGFHIKADGELALVNDWPVVLHARLWPENTVDALVATASTASDTKVTTNDVSLEKWRETTSLQFDLSGSVFARSNFDAELLGAPSQHPMQLKGLVDLGLPVPKLDLTLQAKSVSLELPQSSSASATPIIKQVHLPELYLHLQGDLNALSLEAKAQALTEGQIKLQQPMQLSAQAKLDNQRHNVKNQPLPPELRWGVSLIGLDSQLKLTGHSELNNERLKNLLALNLSIPDLKHWQIFKPLAPAVFTDLEGHLKGQSTAEINIDAQSMRPNYRLGKTDLSGQILKAPVHFRISQVMANRQLLLIEGLDAAAEKNTVQGNLHLAPKIARGRIDINIPSLGSIHPLLNGAIQGQTIVSGEKSRYPSIDTNIEAVGLNIGQVSVEKVTMIGHMKPDLVTGDLNTIEFSWENISEEIRRGSFEIDRTRFALSGTLPEHQASFDYESNDLSVHLALTGAYANQKWRGSWQTLEAQTEDTRWYVPTHPLISLNLNEPTLRIDAHCWQDAAGHGSACFEKPIVVGNTGQLILALERFDLALASPFMPATLRAQGDLTGHIHLNWTAPEVAQAKADILVQTKDLQLQHQLSNTDQGTSIQCQQAKFQLQLANEKLTLSPDFIFHQGARIFGKIQIADLAKTQTLAGELHLKDVDLSRFTILSRVIYPDFSMTGMIHADIKPQGTLSIPRVFGTMALTNFTAQGRIVPFTMRSSTMVINLLGDHSTLQAYIDTENGSALFTGEANWKTLETANAKLQAKSEGIVVKMPPYLQARIVADIQTEATADHLKLSGNVTVPIGKITVASLPPTAIDVSDDEILVGPDFKIPSVKKSRFVIQSNLKLDVGEDVYLEAFGLKSRLEGGLNIAQYNNLLGMTGNISLADGRFVAYGQDLQIRKGSLLFSGPIDQPIVNLEAIRNPDSTQDNVIAGVRVTGNAQKPIVTLFSEPAMSQAETLSYLLRGEGLSNSGGDTNAISSALLGIGLSQTSGIVASVGEALSIRDLGVSTEGAGDESQVVISGYILPNLQLKYAMGLFDSLATITLRYRLIPRLFLETSSGLTQRINLLYQFER